MLKLRPPKARQVHIAPPWHPVPSHRSHTQTSALKPKHATGYPSSPDLIRFLPPHPRRLLPLHVVVVGIESVSGIVVVVAKAALVPCALPILKVW